MKFFLFGFEKKIEKIQKHSYNNRMSSSEEEDVERSSESEEEVEEEEEIEEEEEEEKKEEKETKEEEKPTIVERPLEYGLKRIDRVSRWIDFLRNRMVSIYDVQNAAPPKVKESGRSYAETKTNISVPALSEDKRFQAALDKLLG